MKLSFGVLKVLASASYVNVGELHDNVEISSYYVVIHPH